MKIYDEAIRREVYEQGLAVIRRYDDSWWLSFLAERTIFDVPRIKAARDFLLEQAELAEVYKQALEEIASSNNEELSKIAKAALDSK
ncbi:hypothetical protein [Lysinibacillus piscis]|uniref:Uncharacterized protein n=1 Tax=Lysinibacillus piscis TaxID=2518931 RepID=A0ABQ5NKS0_9BACI|nr:hypothetical protein [Lysinibacillus sp. KH24]GLC88686.1 hypothetical protein LYSBPC_18130 [Lysinibacillus sp. KH24]